MQYKYMHAHIFMYAFISVISVQLIQVWVDFNAGSARARACYGIRLWRKTPEYSKSLGIMCCARCFFDLRAYEYI